MKEMMMEMAANPYAGQPEGEQLQFPAAFGIDGNGTVKFAFYAKEIDGLPSVTDLAGMCG